EPERNPFPSTELDRRKHRDERERRGEHDRDRQTALQHGERLVVVVVPQVLLGRTSAIPGCLDRRDQIVDRDGRRAPHRRLLGGEVDGRIDAVELLELALDPCDARRTRHALDVEANLRRGRMGCGHAASYPASAIAARTAASSSACPTTVTTFESRS